MYTTHDGRKFASRGGPNDASILDAYSRHGLTYDGILGRDGSTRFGMITTQTAAYDDRFIDFDVEGDNPSEVIVSGADLSETWQRIALEMDSIGKENHIYSITDRNSNTAVDEALRRAGLPEPKLDYYYSSPGSGNNMPGGSDDPPENDITETPSGEDATSPSGDSLNGETPTTNNKVGNEETDGDDGIETTSANGRTTVLFDHDGVRAGTG